MVVVIKPQRGQSDRLKAVRRFDRVRAAEASSEDVSSSAHVDFTTRRFAESACRTAAPYLKLTEPREGAGRPLAVRPRRPSTPTPGQLQCSPLVPISPSRGRSRVAAGAISGTRAKSPVRAEMLKSASPCATIVSQVR
jgi:hypothetical protein